MRSEHGGGDRGGGKARLPGERGARAVACEELVVDRESWARSSAAALTPAVPVWPTGGTMKIAAYVVVVVVAVARYPFTLSQCSRPGSLETDN